MAEHCSADRINRLYVGHFLEDDSPFCLSQLLAFDPAGTGLVEHVNDLLEGRVTHDVSEGTRTLSCNMSACSRNVHETTDANTAEKQQTVQDKCFAAAYCLQAAMKLSVSPSNTEPKALTDVLEGTENFRSAYSMGNRCPRLSCGFSAGLSEDMVFGTAGPCEADSIDLRQAMKK
jgi:hypothetical protein